MNFWWVYLGTYGIGHVAFAIGWANCQQPRVLGIKKYARLRGAWVISTQPAHIHIHATEMLPKKEREATPARRHTPPIIKELGLESPRVRTHQQAWMEETHATTGGLGGRDSRGCGCEVGKREEEGEKGKVRESDCT